jgi:hypothetical protein
MHATSFDAAVRSARATARVALAGGAVVLLAMLAPLAVADDTATMRLQQDPREILEAVARQMNVTLRADEPLPRIHLESTAPLEQFQDAVESQWHFRPPRFSNVYVVARNEIYLTDDPGYYRRVRRTLDESLAHEFAHYLQVSYFAANLSDEACETEAVAVQIAFRSAQAGHAPGEAG